MKKFAYMLMGASYQPNVHTASFVVGENETRIVTVPDFEAAKKTICSLQEHGFGAVELCGAFGPEKAQQLIEITKNQLAIGYMSHSPAQDELFNKFFG